MKATQQAIDLESLLEHLRLRGIPVGTLELHRLKAIFQQAPSLTHPELAELLCTVLAKSDQQRKTTLRLFDQLIPQDNEDKNAQIRTLESKQSPLDLAAVPVWEDEAEEETETQEQANKKPKNIIAIGLSSLVIITCSMLFLAQKEEAKHQGGQIILEKKTTANPIEIPTTTEETKPDPLKLIKTLDLWIPSIVEVNAVPTLPRLLPPLSLFFGAGFGFFWLWHKARSKVRQRTPRPPKITKGRGRSFIPPIKDPANFYLLNSDTRRDMSWGISNYLSEQLQNKLDIPKSVAATANSGLPSIRYRQASQQREVWLWLDQGSENPDLKRLADEITQTLQAVNITVQQGYFSALPSKIINQQGGILWSVSHKHPENQALVAVLMDSDSLLKMPPNKAELHNCLSLLSQWQLLAMVDCSIHKGGLKTLTKPYLLHTLLPEEVSHWLARQDRQAPTTEYKQADDIQPWAMACALMDRPISEAEARALHEALGLDCAWQYHALKRYANESASGLDFQQHRVRLLKAFAHLAQNPAYQDYIQRTIQFWLQRMADIDMQRQQQETLERPWKNSQRQYQLKLDIALLQLWLEETDSQQGITQAAKTLHDLYNNKTLQKRVKQALGQYTCLHYQAEANQQKGICLPHDWQTLEAKTQHQLLSSGFAGVDDKQVKLQWDNTTLAILTSLATLSILGLLTALHTLIPQDAAIQVLANSPEPWHKIQRIEQGEIRLGTHQLGLIDPVIIDKNKVEHEKVVDNHIVIVKWQRYASTAAQISLGDDGKSELWRLGTQKKPSKAIHENDVLHSIAIIAESAQEDSARTLAAVLLNKGTADQVLISKKWKHYLKTLQKKGSHLEYLPHTPHTQWLYIGKNLKEHHIHPKKGTHAAYIPLKSSQLTATPSAQPVKLGALQGIVLEGKQEPKIIGLQLMTAKPKKWRKPLQLSQGMKLMPIPKGSFSMGSNEGGGDEKPVHQVTFNYDFYMSQTEITFAQYDAYADAAATQVKKPRDAIWGRENRPVINVSWDDAQGYVNWLTEQNAYGLSCRLPSEAEWEYVARAGTKSKYFWGDEISTSNANCDGCGSQWDNIKTAPVASFIANKFGLYDMHGNVSEWVQDCYHNTYNKAPNDGSIWEDKKCGRRVLRGGSWLSTPINLRSAYRINFTLGDHSSFLGFRVVCSPPSTDH